MKYLLYISIIFACSCRPQSDFEPYKVAWVREVPDSLLNDYRDWLSESVTYVSGDDAWCTVQAISEEGLKLFYSRVEGMELREYRGEYKPTFIPPSEMTDEEIILFNELKNK